MYKKKARHSYRERKACKNINLYKRGEFDSLTKFIVHKLYRVGRKCMKCEEKAVAIARMKDPFCKLVVEEVKQFTEECK